MAVGHEISIGFGAGPGPLLVGDRVARCGRRCHDGRRDPVRREHRDGKGLLQHGVRAAAPAHIWEIIRDFNNYPVWVGGAGESRIEDGKSGDAVGAVRNVLYQGAANPAAAAGAIRCRAVANLRILRAPTLPMAGFRPPCGSRRITDGEPRLRRMVGRFRLRGGPARRTDRDPAGLVREMARICCDSMARPAIPAHAAADQTHSLGAISADFTGKLAG